MIRALIQNWWLLLVRGAFALAFAAIVLFFKPLLPSLLLRPVAYTAIAVIFAVLAIVTGLITVIAAIRMRPHWRELRMLLADGLAITAGGVVVMLVPAITVAHVILIVAATALLAGMLEIVIGTHVRRHVNDEWFLITGGVVAVAFSLAIVMKQQAEIPVLLDWIAVFAAANGVAMIGFSYRLHRLRDSIHTLSSPEHLEKAGNKRISTSV